MFSTVFLYTSLQPFFSSTSTLVSYTSLQHPSPTLLYRTLFHPFPTLVNEFWIANLIRLCPASWLKRHRVALHRQSVLAMISHKVVSSFVAGLLLGGVIAVYGLRSFLFKQHNLMERRFFGSWSNGAIPVRPVLIQKFEPGTANNMTLPLVNPKSSLRSCTQRSCLGPDVTQIHRSVLLVVTGPEKLPVSHSGGFLPLYISTTDEEAKALHEAHSNSLLFTPGNLSNLPFADFQIDIVVVDLSRFPRDLVGPVVTDAVRILMQKGVLFLLGAADFELSNLPLANKLLELGIYENSFVRRLGMAPDVPVCEDCEIWTVGMWRKWQQNPRQQCQAWVQDNYRSVFQPPISTKFDPKSSFEKQRLRHWWRPNVLKILRHGKSWTDEYSAITGPGTYKKSYVTSTPEKLNAGSDELERWIRSRKAKRILDAGAGSCSLEGELLRKGYLPDLHNYLAFGAYDCSMIRICAERGSISFQHDWRQSLYPFVLPASTIWFFSSGECIISRSIRIGLLSLNIFWDILIAVDFFFWLRVIKQAGGNHLGKALEPWEKSKKVTRKEGDGKKGISIYRTCWIL